MSSFLCTGPEDNVDKAPAAQRIAKPLPDLSKLPDDALLTEAQAARTGGYAKQTLKLWRLKKVGRGPTAIFVEGRPRYRVRDVRAWIGADTRAG